MEKISEQFKAMGTDIAVCFLGAKEDAAQREISQIKNRIFEFEKRFSRFLKDSELSMLNNACGAFAASDEMMDILKEIKKYHLETKGIFDPTIVCALESVGYDKSFDKISSEKDSENNFNIETHQEKFGKRSKLSEALVDEKNKQVFIPSELRIDLGGIGKGYIIDKIAQDLIKKGFENFWISAGGDIFLAGKDGDENWIVGVQNPKDLDNDLAKINVSEKSMAIATSGIMKRRGEKGGHKWHHIIDPRTGFPAENDVSAVTVIAPSVAEADVLAKTVLILGKDEGIELINKRNNTECLIIDSDLNVLLSDNMGKYLIKQNDIR